MITAYYFICCFVELSVPYSAQSLFLAVLCNNSYIIHLFHLSLCSFSQYQRRFLAHKLCAVCGIAVTVTEECVNF